MSNDELIKSLVDTINKQTIRIEKLEKHMEVAKIDINDLKEYRDPIMWEEQVGEIQDRLAGQYSDIQVIKATQKRLLDKDMIQLVDPHDLMEIYKQSNITQTELAAHFHTNQATISKTLNGENNDILMRHKIKVYVVEKLIEQGIIGG